MDEKLLQQYMNALIGLAEVHQKAFKGRDIIIPTCFSEALCRSLLNLRKPPSRDIDAVDEEGKKYEIKATSTKSGQTTAKKGQEADRLVWVYFNFDEKKVIIKKADYKYIRSLVENDKKANDRANIRLSQISEWEQASVYDMKNLFT